MVTGGAARWCGRRVADSTTRIRQRRTDSPNRRDVANQSKKERKKERKERKKERKKDD